MNQTSVFQSTAVQKDADLNSSLNDNVAIRLNFGTADRQPSNDDHSPVQRQSQELTKDSLYADNNGESTTVVAKTQFDNSAPATNMN